MQFRERFKTPTIWTFALLGACGCYASGAVRDEAGADDGSATRDEGADVVGDDVWEDGDAASADVVDWCRCPRPGCAGCECLVARCTDPLTCESIDSLRQALVECFPPPFEDPYLLEREARCLPSLLGVDPRNGRALGVVYACSDLCPDYGALFLINDIGTEEECLSSGGVPEYDLGWHGYVGCGPPRCP